MVGSLKILRSTAELSTIIIIIIIIIKQTVRAPVFAKVYNTIITVIDAVVDHQCYKTIAIISILVVVKELINAKGM